MCLRMCLSNLTRPQHLHDTRKSNHSVVLLRSQAPFGALLGTAPPRRFGKRRQGARTGTCRRSSQPCSRAGAAYRQAILCAACCTTANLWLPDCVHAGLCKMAEACVHLKKRGAVFCGPIPYHFLTRDPKIGAVFRPSFFKSGRPCRPPTPDLPATKKAFTSMHDLGPPVPSAA